MPRHDTTDTTDTGLDDFDFLEGVDPDDVVLDDDAVPYEFGAGGGAQDPPLGPPARSGTGERPARGLGLGRAVLLALASVLLGIGVDRVLVASSDRPSAVDIGFARDMIDHHDQAVQMAVATLKKPDIDPMVWMFASEILVYQRWEVGIMDTWLAGWGESRGDEDRVAMQWMGMGTPVGQMPGMQSDAQMAALRAATGSEADRLFLVMMREHHLGGVHMAEAAADGASDERVRDLARRMALNQRTEANEYTALLQRLGLE